MKSIFLRMMMGVTATSIIAITSAQADNLAPQRIGENISLSQPLVLEYAQSDNTQVISHPGADFIKLHFSKLELEKGDYVTVSSSDGTEVFRYPGDSTIQIPGEDGFWSLSVMGDNAVISIHGEIDQPAAADTVDNVIIDQYSYGDFDSFIASEGPVQEAVCGSRDWRNVACYSGTTEYNNSHATARVIFQRDGSNYTCTGWRVGPSASNNLAITNAHCLRNQAVVNTAEFWFGYQYNNCNGNGSARSNRVVVTANRLLEVSSSNQYDMALVTLNNANRISSYGYYELDNRAPISGEEIYIPQHPNGVPKVLSIYNDQNGGGKCEIGSTNRNRGYDIGYSCDTAGGSSGSPVIAASSNKVIALHHRGGCANTGVKVRRFYDLIEPHLSNNATPPPPASGNTRRVQAESGSLTGEARTYDDDSASGGRGVAYLVSGSSVTWNNIPASNGMTVTYASQNSGQISIYVNGQSAGDLGFNGNGAWSGNYTTASAQLNIPAGASVALRNDSGDAALNVDYVVFNRTGNSGNSSNSGGGACTGTDIPTATTSHTNETSAGANDGSITFNFNDDSANGGSRSNIAFSIDGGSTYPYNVRDNSRSTTVNNLAPGNYDLWVRWGNSQCPQNLNDVTIQAAANDSSNNTPPATSDGLVFGIEADGTLYHVNGGQSASWIYLCLNGDCREGTLVGNRWERKTGVTSGTHTIDFKVEDNQTGQCLFSANGVEVGSGVTRSDCQ